LTPNELLGIIKKSGLDVHTIDLTKNGSDFETLCKEIGITARHKTKGENNRSRLKKQQQSLRKDAIFDATEKKNQWQKMVFFTIAPSKQEEAVVEQSCNQNVHYTPYFNSVSEVIFSSDDENNDPPAGSDHRPDFHPICYHF
jgi:hypothetical protein